MAVGCRLGGRVEQEVLILRIFLLLKHLHITYAERQLNAKAGAATECNSFLKGDVFLKNPLLHQPIHHFQNLHMQENVSNQKKYTITTHFAQDSVLLFIKKY